MPERIGRSAAVAAVGCCDETWRSRNAQYVSVGGLNSRPSANAFAVCPLAFHSLTRSDHFVSVSVMLPDSEPAKPRAEYVLHAADTLLVPVELAASGVVAVPEDEEQARSISVPANATAGKRRLAMRRRFEAERH